MGFKGWRWICLFGWNLVSVTCMVFIFSLMMWLLEHAEPAIINAPLWLRWSRTKSLSTGQLRFWWPLPRCLSKSPGKMMIKKMNKQPLFGKPSNSIPFHFVGIVWYCLKLNRKYFVKWFGMITKLFDFANFEVV